MTKHALFSPSSSNRWLNCGASIQFIIDNNIGEGPSNPMREEGVKIHECIELIHKVNQLPPILTQEEITLATNYEHTNSDLFLIAKEFYHSLLKRNKEIDEGEFKQVLFEVERTFALGEDQFGTPDVISLFKNDQDQYKLIIDDGKFGLKKIDAYKNTQLLLYALLVIVELDLVHKDITIDLNIHQPKIKNFDTYTAGIAAIHDILVSYTNVYEHHVNGTSTFNAGPWCEYCKGRFICKERSKDTTIAIDKLTTDIENPKTNVTILPNNHLSYIYKKKAQVEHYIKDVEKEIRKRLILGEDIDGVQLSYSKTNRAWRDDRQVVERFKSLIKEDDLYEKKLLSVSKIEKISKEAKARVKASSELITRKEPELKVSLTKKKEQSQ